MNLFKILFLFSLIVGLDYHGGAQVCPPGCLKTSQSTTKVTVESDGNLEIKRFSSTKDKVKLNQKCQPQNCPPLCRIFCKAICEENVSTQEKEAKLEAKMVSSNQDFSPGSSSLPKKQSVLLE